MSSVKRATLTALCIALCVVLPMAFHAVGLGGAFSPLHIPALFCGLVCGPWYGFFCGTAGVLLSWLITGMPSAAQLVYMLPELAVYGLASGPLIRLLRTGSLTADLLLSLIPAMLLGRVVGGLARLLYLRGAYSIPLWVGAYFTTSLPGILLHLFLLPVLYLLLLRIGLIPTRETKGT